MKKENKVQKDKKKKLIILITVIALIGIIVGSIVIRDVVVNQEAKGENYLAGGNVSSELLARYIQKGITIGGITGTLESLDTSDATAIAEDITLGKTAYVKGKKITGTMEKAPELGNITGKENENTEAQDSLGNKVVVPAGFKVVNPQDNVEKGIIIEDVSAGDSNTKGSQFVWIPVGKIKTSQGEKTITLGRYDFASDGTPTPFSDSSYKEETPIEHKSSGYKNTVAKNIDVFKKSAIAYGGYYIGRYEAGDSLATSSERKSSASDSNPIVCKSGVYPYNYVKQSQAADLCQNMYNSNNFTSDLINSYAWDTTIVFIQECSGDKDYSNQGRLQLEIAKCGEATDGKNKDTRCNIYDMAGNTTEWTTETYYSTSRDIPCVNRGTAYDDGFYSSKRSIDYRDSNASSIACRPILYL